MCYKFEVRFISVLLFVSDVNEEFVIIIYVECVDWLLKEMYGCLFV